MKFKASANSRDLKHWSRLHEFGQRDAGAIWLRGLLKDLNYYANIAIKIFQYNSGCVALANNFVDHPRTKHIDIKLHFLREKVASAVFAL